MNKTYRGKEDLINEIFEAGADIGRLGMDFDANVENGQVAYYRTAFENATKNIENRDCFIRKCV